MSEPETFEDAVKRRDAVIAEAARLYREDPLVHRIASSVIAEAMESIDTPDKEGAYRAVGDAVLRAIAMVAGKGTEANCIMAERDMYRDRILEMARLTPGIPIYASRDATDDVLGK